MTVRRLAGLALLPVFLTVGCATHYIRRDDGRAAFFLRCPGAREVALATSLDGFTPHKAHRSGSGQWVATVDADRDFSYFYLVDGKVFQPDCRMAEADDFGGTNCVYTIVP
jgi:hypothetical protein